VKRRSPPLGLLLLATLFLLPQLWLVSLALKTGPAVYEYPPRLLPRDPSLANLRFVLEKTQVPVYLWNSAKLAGAATLLTLALALPAAFALSRRRFAARETVRRGLLLVQMVSPIVLLVPIYTVVGTLRLLDSHLGLVAAYVAVQLPFTITVLAGFFDGLPPALFEAATLDGATPLRTLRTIALPLVGPGLAATAIFNLAAYWSEFGLALVLLDSQSRFTIPIGLFSLQSGYETEWQIVAAASVIGILPVMAMFVFLQRYFVSGLTAGAVKG
jgi:multiple sugar transport system permease protein